MGSFNGSGTFVRSYSWQTDRDNGIKIRADRMDTEDNGFASGLTNCVTRDGQSPATANLPMANFRHTGVSNAAARTDYAAAGQIQDGGLNFAVTSGTDTYTASLVPAITAYADGADYRIRFANANTITNPTLNINGVGAKTIVARGGLALVAGVIRAGDETVLRYVSASNAFVLMGTGQAGPTLLAKGSASAVSLLEFKSLISSAYVDYVVKVRHYQNGSGMNQPLQFLVSINNGTTYAATAYTTAIVYHDGSFALSSAFIPLSPTGMSNPADVNGVIDIQILSPATSTGVKMIVDALYSDLPTHGYGRLIGWYGSAINAVAIKSSVGTFTCDWEFWGSP